MQATTRLVRIGIYLVCMTWCSASVFGQNVATSGDHGVIPWQADLATAQRLAAQSNRLVLVHFWAPWCAPCMRLERDVFGQRGVAGGIVPSYVPVKVNADQSPALARRLGVMGLPADVVLTPAGQVVARLNSPPTPQAYVEQLQRVAASQRAVAAAYRQTPQRRERPRQDPRRGAVAAMPGTAAGQTVGSRLPPSRPNPYARQTSPALPSSVPPRGVPPAGNPYATLGTPASMPGAAAGPGPGTAPSRAFATRAPATGPGVQTPLTNGARSQASTGRYQTNNSAARPPAANQTWTPSQASPPPAAVGSTARYPAIAAAPSAGPVTQRDRRATSPNGTNGYSAPKTPSAGDRYQNAWQPASGPVSANGQPAPFWRPATTPAGSATPPTRSQPVPPTSASAGNAAPGSNLPLGMDGYCPVTLKKRQVWTRGDRRWGVNHRGRTYLFASAEAQREFLADPDRYSPVLSGVDPVVALEQGRCVPGQRKHGVFYGGQVYLFASETSLDQFSRNPERYATGVRQAMKQAASRIGLR